ncbi:MAG TPA: hypothetical protein DIT15_07090 [Arthrobacter bacterium]|nr:hypothetical protein [Arthrobacter sp.]HBH56983.1 hypothetical protein [Arthrobacter sp.]HCC38972.1 hypothetical protein [Arthrobacter sp.]HCN21996.1 hypothetical protein [Arthrobacter sp.]
MRGRRQVYPKIQEGRDGRFSGPAEPDQVPFLPFAALARLSCAGPHRSSGSGQFIKDADGG